MATTGGASTAATSPIATTAATVTTTSRPSTAPAWRIAFYSERDGNFEIYVMDADGSNPTRLTNDPAEDALPTWTSAP